MRPNAASIVLSARDREIVAAYLRDMAADTHMLLHLSDASLCGDVAALLRAHASRVERESLGSSAAAQLAGPLALYSQT